MKRYRRIRKYTRSKLTIIAMGNKYNHLSYEDRVNIELLHSSGASIRSIAKALGRSPNTISYEIKHLTVADQYLAKKASVKAYQKRYYAKSSCNTVANNKELRDYVDQKLELHWSPGDIAGSTKLASSPVAAVSKRTIYRYMSLYALNHKLYFKGKPKRRKAMYKRSLLGERKWLEERILCDEIGHYELDFIVSSKSSSVLLVAVDTLTKQTKIELLPNRTKAEVSKGLSGMFSDTLVKTILTDNDIAFKHWGYFEQLLGAPFYFTHPYHSWEKGLVENTNKWIRHFIPKRTDLSTVTKDLIAECLAYLNDRPRAILNYKTANALYYELLTN
jgi:transposase, IS30 family